MSDEMITIQIPKRDYRVLAELLYLGRLAASELVTRHDMKLSGDDQPIPPQLATRLKNPLDVLNTTHYWGKDTLERGVTIAWDIIIQAKSQTRKPL